MSGSKHAGGRPPYYKTVEEMQYKIDEYFELQDLREKPYTIVGLALHLGFTGRQGLFEYKGRKEFSDIISRAKARVEEYAASRLFDRDGARGAEFTLRCNYKWRDTETTDDKSDGLLTEILGALKNAKKNVE